jgi:hypothetical protein
MSKKPEIKVYAPAVPGADATVVAVCETMERAREVASRYEHRRDLRMQDVTIRVGDKVIEKCGPCR